MWITARITPDEPVVPWITRITLDYTELPRITAVFWDYSVFIGFLRLLGLLRITSDYSGLLSDYFGLPDYTRLPVRITKWSSGLPEVFPPRDDSGLHQITPHCKKKCLNIRYLCSYF